MVESSSDEILEGADKVDVAFLVVGDPFGYVMRIYTAPKLTDSAQQLTPTSYYEPANFPSQSSPFRMPRSSMRSDALAYSCTTLGRP